MGFCDSVCAGNSGTLPPAAHQLPKIRFFLSTLYLSRMTLAAIPPAAPIQQKVGSLLFLCGTPSSAITSRPELSLASVALSNEHAIHSPSSHYCFFFSEVIITSVLFFFSLSQFFSSPVPCFDLLLPHVQLVSS